MKKHSMARTAVFCIIIAACIAGCGQPRRSGRGHAVPAFPGAEGFGASSAGGRRGRVIKVTNLNPDGPGSLQAACSAEGPRIVVFDVSGVIKAPKRGKYHTISIGNSNITIAGQTAPGAGITIYGMLKTPYKIKPSLHDITIRFLRVRPPRPSAECSSSDCIQITDADRVILDHVSCSWASDENVDLCGSRDITVQWCAIEASDREGHRKGHHNFGMIMGYQGRDATVHHNLFAHHKRRAPLCGLEVLDHRNNVIYNMWSPLVWHPVRMNRQRPGKPFRANVICNYFRRGPRNKPDRIPQTLNEVMSKRSKVHLYERGNYFEWLKKTVSAQGEPKVAGPWPVPEVTTHSAERAYSLVLAGAGCFPRDIISRNTIKEVMTRTGEWGRHFPEQGLMYGLSPEEPPADKDRDGMPDAWETSRGLDPEDPEDRNRIVPDGASPGNRHKGYTYIEYYINSLADELIPLK